MKIAIISNSIESKQVYGYSIVTRYLSSYLKSLGHEVMILGMQTPSGPVILDNGVICMPRPEEQQSLNTWPYYLKIWKTDVLITMMDSFVPSWNWIAEIRDKYSFFWVNLNTLFGIPAHPQLVETAKKADVNFTPSQFCTKTLLDSGVVNNVLTLPHGVNNMIFYPFEEEDKQSLRKRLKIPEGTFVGVYAGRNKDITKNFVGLMKAWKIFVEKVKSDNPDALTPVLLILCDPREPYGHQLLQVRQMSNTMDSIMFPWVRPKKGDFGELEVTFESDPMGFPVTPNCGLQEKGMCEFYNSGDVFVMPSAGESFSLCLVEAMACGVPVIGQDFSAIGEHIRNSGGGKLVTPGYAFTGNLLCSVYLLDEVAFATELFSYFKFPNTRLKDGVRAKEYAIKLDWNNVLLEFGRLLDHLGDQLCHPDYKKGRLGL